MGGEYKVILTPNAALQIIEITAYIQHKLYNPKAAEDFVKLMNDKIDFIEAFPYSYPTVDDKPWNKMGLRKFIVKSFLIYYLPIAEKKQIYVTAVISERRNQIEELKRLVF